MNLREEMKELFENITGHVNHGECFCDATSFSGLCIMIEIYSKVLIKD